MQVVLPVGEIGKVDATGSTRSLTCVFDVQLRITAERVIPGEEVIYTISAQNEGADPAENVVITDPIPEHMTYVAGSAAGMSTEVRFSIDDGESWDTADALRVIDAQGVARRASAEDYTHIQWTFTRSLEPGEDGTVHFRATLN